MAATVFRGAVSFGLVSVPVRLFTATDEKQVPLHLVHRTDGGRVRYRKVCELDGEELSADDVARAYEASDGRLAVLSEEDLRHLPLPGRNTIEVVSFAGADEVDPVQYGRAYLVEADPKAAGKPYALLREAMKESGRVAVVRIALRSREHLALLRPSGDLLVLQLLMWPDEVRDRSAVEVPHASVRAQERKMAASLISSMTEDFDPDRYEDHYREALVELVEAKLEGTGLPAEPEEEGGGEVVDLMEALRASVRRAGDGRSSGTSGRRGAEGGRDGTGTRRSAGGKGSAGSSSGRSASASASKTSASTSTGGTKAAGASRGSASSKGSGRKGTAKKSSTKRQAS